MKRPARAKAAAVIILFVLGIFAGQIRHVLDTVRGNVEKGVGITNELRSTVTTIGKLVDTSGLAAQVADLQAKLAAGTASPAQVDELRALVARLRGAPGAPGVPGPAGAPGPPGPAAAAPAPAPATTTTTARSTSTTTATTRPAATTTTTRPGPSSTTTTTRCAISAGGLIRLGCR